MVAVDSPDVLEDLSVCLVSEALDQPVHCWIKETLVLCDVKRVVASFNDQVVQLEHVLDQQEQVVFGVRIDSMADTRQVGAGVRSAERFGDSPDHLCEPY